MSDIYNNIDDMIRLCREKIVLMQQLKKALMLADLLDIPVKDMKGPVKHVAFDLDYRPIYRWKGMVLRVTYDGTTQDFPLAVVPHDFWPATVLAEYQRHVKKTKPNKE
jgi:hypothetical protein